jgi:hypothetical protein
MMAVTVFVLFGDDVRILFFPPSADSGFEFFFNLTFTMFVVEMVVYFSVKSDFSKGLCNVKGYAFSFFFWLDLLAVLSMVPDVGWLTYSGTDNVSLFDSLGEICIPAFFWQILCMSNPAF